MISAVSLILIDPQGPIFELEGVETIVVSTQQEPTQGTIRLRSFVPQTAAALANMAARRATAPVLVFVNRGSELELPVLGEMLAKLENSSLEAVAMTGYQYVEGVDQRAWIHPIPVTEPGAVLGFGPELIAIRTSAFWHVGGFDPQFETSAGLDLGLRLAKQGLAGETLGANPEVKCESAKLSDKWVNDFMPDWALGRDDQLRPAMRAHSHLLEEEPWRPGPGTRCSIVVLTYNSAQTIDPCLESVCRTVGATDEILVIDNGSQDASYAMAQRWAQKDPRIQAVQNGVNLGFSAGCNVGLRLATGDFHVLLNPDTQVTNGWLEGMLAHFDAPDVGAVGPLSNRVAGIQKASLHRSATLQQTMTTEEFATAIRQQNARRSVSVKFLIGFCLMVPRTVYDKLGLLDEKLFLGNDDFELSWRLRTNGYRLKVATDVFVSHCTQVSFKSLPSAVVEQYIEESRGALKDKMVRHYGELPDATQLWGINIWEERLV